MNVITYIVGIGIGILLSIALSFVLVNETPFIISEYLPVFIGAFTASIIIKRKFWLIGTLIPTALILVSLAGLYYVAMSTSGKLDTTQLSYKILFQWALDLPVGLFGAYLGLVVSVRRQGQCK